MLQEQQEKKTELPDESSTRRRMKEVEGTAGELLRAFLHQRRPGRPPEEDPARKAYPRQGRRTPGWRATAPEAPFRPGPGDVREEARQCEEAPKRAAPGHAKEAAPPHLRHTPAPEAPSRSGPGEAPTGGLSANEPQRRGTPGNAGGPARGALQPWDSPPSAAGTPEQQEEKKGQQQIDLLQEYCRTRKKAVLTQD